MVVLCIILVTFAIEEHKVIVNFNDNDSMDIRLTLGSNTDQQRHIEEAQKRLRALFPSIRFEEPCWTTPVGIVSDDFLNVEAIGTTDLALPDLTATLKEIEYVMGDHSANHRKGIVLIDIDLIDYGDLHLKDIIWKKE